MQNLTLNIIIQILKMKKIFIHNILIISLFYDVLYIFLSIFQYVIKIKIYLLYSHFIYLFIIT